jgi:NAD-dependent SIR2 family protein deacetylase
VQEYQLNQVFQHFEDPEVFGDNLKQQFVIFLKIIFILKIKIKDLATPTAFARSPSLVWEFYHYRRELVRTKEPNKVYFIFIKIKSH